MFQLNNLRRPDKVWLTIAYKLLYDALLILLVFFILAMIAEGLLPGIVTNHIGLYKIALPILADMLAIFGLQKLAGLEEGNKMSKKTAYSLVVLLALLLFNSIRHLNIFLALFILLSALAAVYFMMKVLQENQPSK